MKNTRAPKCRVVECCQPGKPLIEMSSAGEILFLCGGLETPTTAGLETGATNSYTSLISSGFQCTTCPRSALRFDSSAAPAAPQGAQPPSAIFLMS